MAFKEPIKVQVGGVEATLTLMSDSEARTCCSSEVSLGYASACHLYFLSFLFSAVYIHLVHAFIYRAFLDLQATYMHFSILRRLSVFLSLDHISLLSL